MKKGIFIILAVLIVLAGVYVYLKGRTQTAASPTKAPETFSVLKNKQPIQDDALFTAARKGDTQTLAKLLQQGYDVNYVCTQQCKGWTPLLIASAEGHTDTVKFLLEHGANPNAQNRLGRTSLHFAANYGFEPIVTLLLQYGADPTIETYDKPEEAPRKVVETALRQTVSDPQNQAAYRILKMLVYKTDDVNCELWDYTPLVEAFRHNDYDFAKYLLEHGANPYHIKTVTLSPGQTIHYELEHLSTSSKMQALLRPYQQVRDTELELLQKQGLPNFKKLQQAINAWWLKNKNLPKDNSWAKNFDFATPRDASYSKGTPEPFEYHNSCSGKDCLLTLKGNNNGKPIYSILYGISLANKEVMNMCEPQSYLGKSICLHLATQMGWHRFSENNFMFGKFSSLPK